MYQQLDHRLKFLINFIYLTRLWGSFLSTTLNDQKFLYEGYKMAVFPDSVDKKTPMIGYLPGHMPWAFYKATTKVTCPGLYEFTD